MIHMLWSLPTNLLKPFSPKTPNATQYVKKQYFQNLFSIEPNRAMIKDPLKLATNYFPLNFHWIPKHNGKNLSYYSAIIFHEKSVLIKSIPTKIDNQKLFTIVFSSSM